MKPIRRMAAVLVLALAGGPLAALDLGGLAGDWRGEGWLSLDNEPEQRLRCQVRFADAGAGRTVFTGRCATAQGSRSFSYTLAELGEGRVLAENRQPAEADTLPETAEGRIDPGALSFQGQSGTLIALELDGPVLRLRIEGQDSDGFARGEALMRRP